MPALIALVLALSVHGYRADLSDATGFLTYCYSAAQWHAIGYYDEEGAAFTDTKRIALSPETCRNLTGHWDERVNALHTLGHERGHLHGIANETEADCYGLKVLPLMAKKLKMRIPRRWIAIYIKGSELEKC